MDQALTLRPLASPGDYDACVALQRATWGDDFRELVPPAMLQIAQKVGGIAAGAFEGDRLVGFVFGLTGLERGRPVHWSHMLAVEPGLRDQGIGRRLKAYQRDYLAALGVARMYWTFDPLVARNAHLNLNVLGARVVEYARDMYGENPMSRTDSVIGSDRFVVAWDLESTPRAATPGGHGRSERRGHGRSKPGGRNRAVKGGHGRSEEQGGHGRSQAVADGRQSPARPTAQPPISSESDPLPDASSVLIAIPPDIQALKLDDPDAALRWRRSTRRAFEHYLEHGYIVKGVGPHPEGRGSCYLVDRTP